MSMTELWLPMIGDGKGMNEFRPDMPEGIHWTSDEAAPSDLVKYDGTNLTTEINILVDEKDLPAINKHLAEQHKPEAVPFADGPEKDVRLVSMIRACRDDYDRKADAYFDSIPNMTGAHESRKRMVKDILLQARARGLSAEKAEEIRLRHKLPASEMVEVP